MASQRYTLTMTDDSHVLPMGTIILSEVITMTILNEVLSTVTGDFVQPDGTIARSKPIQKNKIKKN